MHGNKREGDQMGSYQLVINTAGTTALANRDYDSFGNRIYLGGSTASPFGYAGAWGYQEDAGIEAGRVIDPHVESLQRKRERSLHWWLEDE